MTCLAMDVELMRKMTLGQRHLSTLAQRMTVIWFALLLLKVASSLPNYHEVMLFIDYVLLLLKVASTLPNYHAVMLFIDYVLLLLIVGYNLPNY